MVEVELLSKNLTVAWTQPVHSCIIQTKYGGGGELKCFSLEALLLEAYFCITTGFTSYSPEELY